MFFRDILLNQVLSLATSTFKTRHFFGSWQSRCVLKIEQDSFILFSSFIVKIRLILKLIGMIIFEFLKHALPSETEVKFHSDFCFLLFTTVFCSAWQFNMWVKEMGSKSVSVQSLRCFSFFKNLAYSYSIFLLPPSSLMRLDMSSMWLSYVALAMSPAPLHCMYQALKDGR